MPIYEFECVSCGQDFEKILSFSSTESPSCPACGAEEVNRRLSRPAIHFKGSGWYITDSKQSAEKNGTNGKNGSGKEGAESKPAESKTETTQTGASETKTADSAKSTSTADSSSANSG